MARADGGRRGEVGKGQREAGKRQGRCWGVTWPASRRLWSREEHGTRPARAAAARGRETEERGREVDEGGPS
jgi:hypothetical protein